MDEKEFLRLLRETKITKQIDISGSLQVGIQTVLQESGVLDERIRFSESSDLKVLSIRWVASFLGESVLDILTRMSNNFGIDLAIIPTENGGFVLFLEAKEGG